MIKQPKTNIMSYNMLGLFSFKEVSDGNFEITYEIPDNCDSNMTIVLGEYVIAITLQSGQTEPSKDFREASQNVSKIGSGLCVIFAQYEYSGTITRKPKITIGF